MAVGIEVLRSNVVRTGAVNPFGVADQVIAVIIPLVPVVAIPRVFDFVLRVRTGATNHDHFALTYVRAPR